MKQANKIIIFKTKDGSVKLEVNLQKETVWLDLNQMARLFGRDKSSISRHISNIFKTKELEQKSTVAKFATVQSEGGRNVTRNIEHYNLDVIISVGYRINSRIGTQFRIWATNVLKSYLVSGYVLSQKRLLEREKSLRDLKEAISFITSKTEHPQLTGKTDDLLKLLNEYSNALTILHEYDDKSLAVAKRKTPVFTLTFEHAREIVSEISTRLMEKGEATELFGREYGHKLSGIIGALYQTFDKKELYGSVEEKAAHILYLIIKDHPFSDGNKRLGSILFVYYLEKNGYLDKESGGRKIIDNTVVALSLLIASSDPREKDMMIKIITNLLRE